MFTQFKNIDTAFSHIKRFSYLFLICNLLTMCFGIYKFCEVTERQAEKVLVLYNGKVLEAIATDRKSNLPVELRDHVRTFHEYFFNLSPDEKAIEGNISKALYQADGSAKRAYDNLKEQGFFSNMIAANISQEITVDSITLDMDSQPYRFTCYATEQLVRATSTLTRRLVSRGQLRELKVKTDNNPHGFLIQNWEIIENSDQGVKR